MQPKINHYEDLVAWQFANELADLVDTLVSTGGAARNESFHDQILKSSAKAPAQIAEGFVRFRPKESAYYYRIARASLAETRNHLQRGHHRRYWDDETSAKALKLCTDAMNTTGGLLASRLAAIEQEERDRAERHDSARRRGSNARGKRTPSSRPDK